MHSPIVRQFGDYQQGPLGLRFSLHGIFEMLATGLQLKVLGASSFHMFAMIPMTLWLLAQPAP